MNVLRKVFLKYNYDSYDEDIDGDMYDYFAYFQMPAKDFLKAFKDSLRGKAVDKDLSDLILCMDWSNMEGRLLDEVLVFSEMILIRDKESCMDALRDLSKNRYFVRLYSSWTGKNITKEGDYVQPVPRW